jgi:catechol 2,3-dioxygenase-like lactoylglutathione lyase family enzyme
MGERNEQFELRGVNHLALVCRDMARTVEFYRDILGMPLVKTIELPGGVGQHFFFDIGNGDCLAFFWFPHAPDGVPGVSLARGLPGRDDFTTAVGTMNHVAFNVHAEKIEEYRERLKAKGIKCTPVINHDNSPDQISETMTDDVYIRSVYFMDPDGIMLEFAAWTKPLGESGATDDVLVASSRVRDGITQQERV